MTDINAPFVACPYCDGGTEQPPCEDCGGSGRIRRTVYFAVAELNNPAAEPFAVMRIDVSKPRGNGVEAVVESVHWSRDVAGAITDQLNRAFGWETRHD